MNTHNISQPVTSAILLDEIRAEVDARAANSRQNSVKCLFHLIASFIEERRRWGEVRDYQITALNHIRGDISARFDRGQEFTEAGIDDFVRQINDAAKTHPLWSR